MNTNSNANNPNNNKRGGVGIYFKEFLGRLQVELNWIEVCIQRKRRNNLSELLQNKIIE